MSSLKKHLEENYYSLSNSELLIYEILKPVRPFEYCRHNKKLALKYKNPEVSNKD